MSRTSNYISIAAIIISLLNVYRNHRVMEYSERIREEVVSIGSLIRERDSLQTRVDSLYSTGKKSDYREAAKIREEWNTKVQSYRKELINKRLISN